MEIPSYREMLFVVWEILLGVVCRFLRIAVSSRGYGREQWKK